MHTRCPPRAGEKNIAARARFWLYPGANFAVQSRSQMRVHYSGRVQGVGFRHTARTVAAGFKVTGAVRNLPDGRVELVAEGERAELEAFAAAIRESGPGGFISDEQAQWRPAGGGFSGFEIAR